MNRTRICLDICFGISLLCTIVFMMIVHFLPLVFATVQYYIGSRTVKCEFWRFLWHRSETCDSSTPQDFTNEVLSEGFFGSKNLWKALSISCTLSTAFAFLGCFPAFYLIRNKEYICYRNVFATLGCVLMIASSVCMLIPVIFIANKIQHLVDSSQKYEEHFRDVLQIFHTNLFLKNTYGIILAALGAFFASISANIFIIIICKEKLTRNKQELPRNVLEHAGYGRIRLPGIPSNNYSHPFSSSSFHSIDRRRVPNEITSIYEYIDIS